MITRHYIVFPEHKLIYARIPKVANSSIKAALTHLLKFPPQAGVKTTADKFWKTGTNNETQILDAKHARALRHTHFSFSFVRNPFDRLVSGYNNKIIEEEPVAKAMQFMGFKRHMSFASFIDAVCRTDDEQMDVHFMPQSTILTYRGLLVPKFVGRFEHIQKDWHRLNRRLRSNGFPTLGALPSKNVRRSGKTDLRTLFHSAHLVDRILEKYAEDFSYFYSGASIDDLLSLQLPDTISPIARKRFRSSHAEDAEGDRGACVPPSCSNSSLGGAATAK
jgi:dermatan 4-sulfotransferase 1